MRNLAGSDLRHSNVGEVNLRGARLNETKLSGQADKCTWTHRQFRTTTRMKLRRKMRRRSPRRDQRGLFSQL
ncbi:pentapeptide repeat-containing protein [Saccharopolyspora sp. NPDC049426]|uniref:pentapeptide repeat-containing protein n=1 Tax=Saccharopolyspora sp. NPDC049426 TaxID=3155652 RepID=UPI0034202EB4